VLTASSWLVLGYFYGLGYCFLTDWHWQVKRALGVRRLPGSFIKYAADFVTGSDFPPNLVDTVAGIVFLVGCTAAIWRYLEERKSRADSR
jgi:hypothetical protein